MSQILEMGEIVPANQVPDQPRVSGLQKIEFSYNWNKKLDCSNYTTFRMANPSKFRVGGRFGVYLNGKHHHDAEILDVKTLTLGQVNEWIARLDSGYSRDKFFEIVRKMYKDKSISYDVQKWNLVLFQKLK